jgi:hypothetical protein
MKIFSILKNEKIFVIKNNIKKSNFGKYYFYLKQSNKNLFLKVFTKKKTFIYYNNELNGLKYSSKKKQKKVFFPKLIKSINKKNYKILIYRSIKHTRKIFKHVNFYNLELSNPKQVSIGKYQEIVSFLKKDKVLGKDKQIRKFLLKFKNEKVFLSVSHGDFVHYNIIKSDSKNYLIDFEYFSKKRIFLHDEINWYFAVMINYFINQKFNHINLFSRLVLIYLKYYTYYNLKKLEKNQIRIKTDIYVFIFILEKLVILSKDLNLDKYNKTNKIKKRIYYNILFKALDRLQKLN